MMVARHEMPGKAISGCPSRRVRYDRVVQRFASSFTMNKDLRHYSYRSLRDGSYLATSQAFHAWLPSSGPYGTINLFPSVDANGRLPGEEWNRNDY
jgi:hypothetical protein